MSRWQLARAGCFIDIGGIDPVGHEPDLPQQVEPARRGRSKHEEWRRHPRVTRANAADRKSTRLNSSHSSISYAVFCLKKKKKNLLSSKFYTKRITINRK